MYFFDKMPFNELTSNQFIDGMKKIFELEPFINIERDHNYQTNTIEDQVVSIG